MKKILLFALLIAAITDASAQKPRFGFNAGITLNQAKYEPEAGLDRRIFAGFDGGMLVEFTLGKRLFLQPELNYLITGVELNTGFSEKAIKLQYATIPLLVKYNVAGRLNLVAGPQHSILLSAWEDHSGLPSRRVKEQFKFSDIVLIAGAEYKCRNGLFFGARYNYSVEQIAEEGMGFEMMNRFISARVGYTFGNP
jgi:Outer membrane protein beta-barrel domain